MLYWSRKLGDATYKEISNYWLPAGFFLFLTGLFLAPSAHNYKVIINYMLLLPALLCCFAVPRWWRYAQQSAPLLALFCTYLLYMAGNAWWRDPVAGFEFLQWSLYIAVFVIGVGLCMQMAPRHLHLLLWSATMIAAGAAAYAISRDVLNGALTAAEYRLVGYGPLYNPLRSGHLFGVFFVTGIWNVLIAPATLPQRWLAGVASTILFIAILLTGSRSPLLALVAMAIWLAVFEAPAQRRWRYLGVIAAVIAVAFALFRSSLLLRGWSLRPELWSMVLTAVPEHLWLGAGLGQQISMTATNGLFYNDTHNIFLAALYYGGVVGLLLFVALFGSAFVIAWRQRKNSTLCALAAALQIFGIATLQFDGGSLIGRPTEFWILFWLPMALMLYARRHMKDGVDDA